VRTVPGSDRTLGSVALRVQSLRCGDRVRDVSFDLHNGEILGVAGLVGSGRTELLRAIFGADPPEAGTLIVGDDLRPRRFRHPRDAVRAGLGMVPEDRKLEGLLLPLPIAVNLSLARLDLVRSRFGRLDRRRELEAAEQLGERVQLRGTRSVHQPAAELSGGNQQKVVVGRWLWHEPKVLLLDEPTRGVDVAAKRTIHALIADLARRGRAILVVSSDLEELMSLSDRIVVLSAGRLVATFVRATWTHQAILAAAFHEYTGRGAAGEA
jgi:ribose transport system ATP-binding protein